jgi:hypothetical protein
MFTSAILKFCAIAVLIAVSSAVPAEQSKLYEPVLSSSEVLELVTSYIEAREDIETDEWKLEMASFDYLNNHWSFFYACKAMTEEKRFPPGCDFIVSVSNEADPKVSLRRGI